MPTIKGVRQLGDQSGSVELAETKIIRRYTLEYVVIADNTGQGPITIRSTAGLPKVGINTFSYNGESDTVAVCKRKTPTRNNKNPLIWFVLCEFDNDPSSQSQENEDNAGTDATLRPPIIEWDSEYGEEVLHQDFSSPRVDIVNPVGHAFDPPVTRRVIYPVLSIERYQSTFVPATILAYEDHVNDDVFYGASAGHALMAKIRARQVNEDGTLLWQVNYRIRFAISADGFDLKPLNQGTHYYNNTTEKKLIPFIEGRVPYVGNLNADGTKAADGVRTYSTFKGFPEADFDALNLE